VNGEAREWFLSPTLGHGSEEPMPDSPTIQELAQADELDAGRIDAFLEGHAFPIAEPPNYTFVYRGSADAVHLRHWIYGLPASQPFRRLGRSDLWYRTVELPDDSRVEYKLEIRGGGHVRWIEDPLNPHSARDPFGANSVVTARGYEVPEWTRFDPDARPGTLEERTVDSRELGETRRVSVYLPARFRVQRRYPLLVVHDGGDYLEYASLRTVLDNLIHRLEIPSVLAALVHPGARMREYAALEAHSRFLSRELVPALEAEFPLLGTPEGRGILGASLGAVASLAAATHEPKFWGKLLLQSGSFAFTDIGDNPRGPVFDPIVEFMNHYRSKPAAVAGQVFMTAGVYESLVYENRSLVPVLRSTGMQVRYVEARDGHNWENWRDRLREGLSWLFPGPLWMVYE
jgi:enterochelin esterase family protein